MWEKRAVIQRIRIVVVVSILSLAANLVAFAATQERMRLESTTPETITLVLGKSLIVESPGMVKRVAIAQPSIVEVMVLSPRQIYLNAKSLGTTNLTLWDTSDKVFGVMDIEVMPDVNLLKERIYKIFPSERAVSITASRDFLTVQGSVSSLAVASQIMEIARAYLSAEKEGQSSKLINLLQVAGVQQVMLEVRVSEMSRNLGRRLGINVGNVSSTAQQFGVSLLGGLSSISQTQGYPLTQRLPIWPSDNIITLIPKDAGYPVANQDVSSAVNMILRFLGGGASWTVFIDALKEHGLIKVLAEPTLITLSGKEAQFLAGGEFPIPVPDSLGRVTISYKPFGVGLVFTPVVLSNDKISLQVAPEVSELDFGNSITIGGFVIPSITTRRVATTIELGDGQSFAIAGLLKEDIRETVKKFPLLGDIPVLGPLFRSSSFQKTETELIVVVTPRLVKALDASKQTLPTDQFVEPNDLEFYLLGRSEGRGAPKPNDNTIPAPHTSQPRNSSGHIMPK